LIITICPDHNDRILVREDGRWNAKGRFSVAIEDNEHLDWSLENGQYCAHVMIVIFYFFISVIFDLNYLFRIHLNLLVFPSLVLLPLDQFLSQCLALRLHRWLFYSLRLPLPLVLVPLYSPLMLQVLFPPKLMSLSKNWILM